MTRNEFEEKLRALPIEEPDEIDKVMLAEAASTDDGTTVNLDDFRQALEGYSGKIVLRIPKSLHKTLKERAAAEGVSLNQYMLYKLSQP